MQRVSTGEQKTQRGCRRPFHLHHRFGVDGWNEADGHTLANHPLLDQSRRGAQFIVRETNRCARKKMWPNFPNSGIKSETCEMTRAVPACDAKGFYMPPDEVTQIGVGNLNPFGDAARPRGIDHIGETLRLDGPWWHFRRGSYERSFTAGVDAAHFDSEAIKKDCPGNDNSCSRVFQGKTQARIWPS